MGGWMNYYFIYIQLRLYYNNIPNFPKKHIGKANSDEIQNRRVLLQHYLRLLIQSPVFYCSLFYSFLHDDRKGVNKLSSTQQSDNPNRIVSGGRKRRKRRSEGKRMKSKKCDTEPKVHLRRENLQSSSPSLSVCKNLNWRKSSSPGVVSHSLLSNANANGKSKSTLSNSRESFHFGSRSRSPNIFGNQLDEATKQHRGGSVESGEDGVSNKDNMIKIPAPLNAHKDDKLKNYANSLPNTGKPNSNTPVLWKNTRQSTTFPVPDRKDIKKFLASPASPLSTKPRSESTTNAFLSPLRNTSNTTITTTTTTTTKQPTFIPNTIATSTSSTSNDTLPVKASIHRKYHYLLEPPPQPPHIKSEYFDSTCVFSSDDQLFHLPSPSPSHHHNIHKEEKEEGGGRGEEEEEEEEEDEEEEEEGKEEEDKEVNVNGRRDNDKEDRNRNRNIIIPWKVAKKSTEGKEESKRKKFMFLSATKQQELIEKEIGKYSNMTRIDFASLSTTEVKSFLAQLHDDDDNNNEGDSPATTPTTPTPTIPTTTTPTPIIPTTTPTITPTTTTPTILTTTPITLHSPPPLPTQQFPVFPIPSNTVSKLPLAEMREYEEEEEQESKDEEEGKVEIFALSELE